MSELRKFRMNKPGQMNGTKLANGRKRIRAVSDSSDEEHENNKQKKLVQNGDDKDNGHGSGNGTSNQLSIEEKTERLKQLKEICEPNSDSLVLQDVLFLSNWDVQKAYDTLIASPTKYKNSTKTVNNASSSTSSAKAHSKVSKSKFGLFENEFYIFFLFDFCFRMKRSRKKRNVMTAMAVPVTMVVTAGEEIKYTTAKKIVMLSHLS